MIMLNKNKIFIGVRKLKHVGVRKLEYRLIPGLVYKKGLGEILAFKDVPIVPYEQLFAKLCHLGGPIWPDWFNQVEARHCKYGIPIDDLPNQSINLTAAIEKPAAWCGPIVHHFGHQISDFSTRILHTRVTHPEAKLLFSAQVNSNIVTLANTPPFFRALLNWYNINPEEIEIVNKPTIAHELFVAPQAEQRPAYGPSQEYLDLINEHVERNLRRKTKKKAIFVSRAGIITRFAGEAYIENLMRSAGICVIRPETMNLEEQLAEYDASEKLIFSEGSALHCLQLLGQSVGHVQVLNRRRKSRCASTLINARADSLSYVEVTKGIIHGLNLNGKPNTSNGLSIFNEDSIVDYICSIDPKVSGSWKRELYLEHRDKDIILWLNYWSKHPTMKVPRAKETIIKKLRELDLHHFVPFAEKL